MQECREKGVLIDLQYDDVFVIMCISYEFLELEGTSIVFSSLSRKSVLILKNPASGNTAICQKLFN